MRLFLISAAAAALTLSIGVENAFAQGHERQELNSCIREFYDPDMYNYLTYQNNCTQSLTLVFVAKDGSGTSGTMELRPGAKDSVGKMEGRTPKVGGFQLYVCQSGYVPVDEKGKVVTKPRTSFQCQPKSQ